MDPSDPDLARLRAQWPGAACIAIAETEDGSRVAVAQGRSVSELRASMLKRGGGKWEIVQLRKPRPKGAHIRSLTQMRAEYETEERERARAARRATG